MVSREAWGYQPVLRNLQLVIKMSSQPRSGPHQFGFPSCACVFVFPESWLRTAVCRFSTAATKQHDVAVHIEHGVNDDSLTGLELFRQVQVFTLPAHFRILVILWLVMEPRN